MSNYWMKEIPESCYLPDGRQITVDFVGVDGNGYLQTSVGYLNHQLAIAVKDGIGGWVVSTEQQYQEALKKNETKTPLQRRNNLYRANQLPTPRRNAAGAVEASSIEIPMAPKPDPIRVPTPDQMRPRKGPIPKEAFI